MSSFETDRHDPHRVAEERLLATGRRIGVNRRACPSEGPRLVRHGDQVDLVYMYARFVFTWPEFSRRVHIGYGTVADSIPLYRGHPIDGTWWPDRLVAFGTEWAQRHIAVDNFLDSVFGRVNLDTKVGRQRTLFRTCASLTGQETLLKRQ